jgi:hypothetical protein
MNKIVFIEGVALEPRESCLLTWEFVIIKRRSEQSYILCKKRLLVILFRGAVVQRCMQIISGANFSPM